MTVWLVGAVALFFLAMGLVALVRPARILAPLGVTVESLDGRNEVRAVYGGFGVMMAAILVYALKTPEVAGGVYLAVAVALAGMAAGRVASLVIERKIGAIPAVFIGVEAGLAAMLWVSI